MTTKNQLSTLHDIAMEFADEARFAQKRGDYKTAKLFYTKAFMLEKQFALAIPQTPPYALSRSVFLRSAANLALASGELSDAISIAETALHNNPNPAILPELNEVIEKAKQLQNNHSTNTIYITGKLVSADIPNREIKVEGTDHQQYYIISVPEGSITEVVKQFWEGMVNLKGVANEQGSIVLETIQEAA